MPWSLAFKPYVRRFRTPWATARRLWHERHGFLVRLHDGLRTGHGEVAPLPDFGTESTGDAARWLARLAREGCPDDAAGAVPSALRACAAGLASACADACGTLPPPPPPRALTRLLPLDAAFPENLAHAAREGWTTVKVKIGLRAPAEERALLASGPRPGPALRLDANGALDAAEARRWLAWAADHGVEFLEQPLPPGQETACAELAREHGARVALDESAQTPEQFAELERLGFTGTLVAKPSLLGDPRAWTPWIGRLPGPWVWSSALETGLGAARALRLGAAHERTTHAAGFDTGRLFDDTLGPDWGPVTRTWNLEPHAAELWNRVR